VRDGDANVTALAVLAGGARAEHEVSLQTSSEMLAVLREGGHRARPVLITREGRWRFGTEHEPLGALLDSSAPGLPLADALAELGRTREIAVLGVHGLFGEDGELQRHLEDHGIRFTGSGSHASAVGMDKELTKLAATKLGVRCARHEVVAGKPAPARLLKAVGLPCFVKPVAGGSSVGVSRVLSADELLPAIAKAAAEDPQHRALVESAVDGTEVTCGVLRWRGDVRPLPLVAIEPANGFYDYHAKYVADDTRLTCPADVPDAARREMESAATGLYTALEMRGAVRFDFIVRREDQAPVFLELNTLPGFTSHSLVPRAAAVAGLSRLDVLEALLADAEAAR
jgi:D-alanine-D-alanine ligase